MKSPKPDDKDSFAWKNISMKETYSMTPAEKPRDKDSSFLFVRLVKKASALPRQVERPANKVNPNAVIKTLKSIIVLRKRDINALKYATQPAVRGLTLQLSSLQPEPR
jgi:hypothetical protein